MYDHWHAETHDVGMLSDNPDLLAFSSEGDAVLFRAAASGQH